MNAKLNYFCKLESFFSRKALLWVMLLLTLGFFFMQIKSYLIGNPPTSPQVGPAEILFDKFLATNDPQNLFRVVDLLFSRKLSSLSLKEQYILVDSLTMLARLFPEDFEIKLRLAVVSFLFGAYSKSLEIVESLRNLNNEDERLKELHVLNLIVIGNYDQASLLMESLKNSLSKQTLESYLNFKKSVFDLAQLKENLVEPLLAELIKLAETRVTFKSEDPVAKMIRWFFENEIIGSKIRKHFVESGFLVIVLENFPISKMPPQIRQTFTDKIKELLTTQERIEGVKLVDQSDSQEVFIVKKN
jgi:hypothetical protein